MYQIQPITAAIPINITTQQQHDRSTATTMSTTFGPGSPLLVTVKSYDANSSMWTITTSVSSYGSRFVLSLSFSYKSPSLEYTSESPFVWTYTSAVILLWSASSPSSTMVLVWVSVLVIVKIKYEPAPLNPLSTSMVLSDSSTYEVSNSSCAIAESSMPHVAKADKPS